MRTATALLLLALPGCGGAGGSSSSTSQAPVLDPRTDLDLRNALHDALHGDEAAGARGRDRLIRAGSQAVPLLLEAMSQDASSDESNPAKALAAERLRRRRIFFLLGEIRSPAAIPVLLENFDGEVSGKALAKITGVSLGNDLQAWREWYVSQPPASRDELDRALSQFKRQGDRERLETVKGLAEATRPRTGAAMLEALPAAMSRADSLQVRLLNALELDRCRAALALLPEALLDPNPEVRRYARMVALQLGPMAVGTLRRLASSAPAEARIVIVYTLGEIGDPRALPELTQGLSDPDAVLRARCAWALGQIGDAAASSPLERRLAAEPEAPVRAAILGAMVLCGQVDRFETLAALLESPGAREAAAAHLESICRKAFTLTLQRRHRLHLPATTEAWQTYWKHASLGQDPAKWKAWWTDPEGPARDLFVHQPQGGMKP